MKLRKVISGGQTGADRAGLEYARALGLATGGTAPKGYRTESGPDITLKALGLQESHSASYPPRTRQNVQDADVTLWFGNIGSPGYWCTLNACNNHRKPFKVNPSRYEIIALANEYTVWNVAGNRESKNPGVLAIVKAAFDVVAELIRDNSGNPV